MIKPILFILISSVILSSSVFSQTVEIKPESVKKKKRFRAKVELTNGSIFNGKLAGITDSSIMLYVTLPIKDYSGNLNDTVEISCELIEKIRLKHRSTLGMVFGGIIGAVAGLFPAAGVALALDPIDLSGSDSGSSTGASAAFSAVIIAFTGAGVGIGCVAGKKYIFGVDGSCERFQQHLPGLQKMSLAQRNE